MWKHHARKFITAKLSIRKPGYLSALIIIIIIIIIVNSTDKDSGLRIESFAVINVRGVSTNNSIICFIAMQTYKELKWNPVSRKVYIYIMRHQGKFFVLVTKWNVSSLQRQRFHFLSPNASLYLLMTKYNDLVHAQKAYFQFSLHPKQFYGQEWNPRDISYFASPTARWGLLANLIKP